MTSFQIFITIAAVVLGTVLTRFLPYICFPQGRKTPRYITYLGKVLAPAVFGLLVIYDLLSPQRKFYRRHLWYSGAGLHRRRRTHVPLEAADAALHGQRNDSVHDSGADCFSLNRIAPDAAVPPAFRSPVNPVPGGDLFHGCEGE